MTSRISRRTVFVTSILATAVSFFTLGLMGARSSDASAQASHAQMLEAIRSQIRSELGSGRHTAPAATVGLVGGDGHELVARDVHRGDRDLAPLRLDRLEDASGQTDGDLGPLVVRRQRRREVSLQDLPELVSEPRGDDDAVARRRGEIGRDVQPGDLVVLAPPLRPLELLRRLDPHTFR